MTEKELNSLFYLDKRIAKLERRKAELAEDDGVNGIDYNGMPHGTGVSAPVERLATAKVDLLLELTSILAQRTAEETRIRRYIESVGDEEIKIIMEDRFIYQMSFDEIGDELHLDRTTVSKKMRRYLKGDRYDTD